jgi:hypothetical protein
VVVVVDDDVVEVGPTGSGTVLESGSRVVVVARVVVVIPT